MLRLRQKSCTWRLVHQHHNGRLRLFATSSSSTTSSSTLEPSTATDTSVPVASQTNGFQHGSTIYGLHRDVAVSATLKDKFHIQKTHDHIFNLWKPKSRSGNHQDAPITSSPAALLRDATERIAEFVWDLFLPRDAHTSLTKDYFPYAKWYFLGSVVSSASGVLSMQSLLYAIGLGAGSIPTAAAVNWVLKDGLGQFGGVMFASLVNNRYDADPKRWRTASAVALDTAVLMEILTPLCPNYFLPMASLANVAKNISWLSASATRAGFHNSFSLKENLADITAKAGSQTIASSIIGTGLGIVISQWTGASITHVISAFGVLSAIHLFSVYRSLNTTNEIPSLQKISEQEEFIPTLLTGYKSLFEKSFVNADASLNQITQGSPRELLRLKTFYADEKYLINMTLDGITYRIDLALEENATSKDTLSAHMHAVLIQRAVEDQAVALASGIVDSWQVVEQAYETSKRLQHTFLERLANSEWHIDNLLVEEQSARYKWLFSEECNSSKGTPSSHVGTSNYSTNQS